MIQNRQVHYHSTKQRKEKHVHDIAKVHQKVCSSSGWCGSVDWAPVCEPKGRQLDSQLGHKPGLWARSPVGDMWEATTHWCFSPSLSPSLALSLKINKYIPKKKRKLCSRRNLKMAFTNGSQAQQTPNSLYRITCTLHFLPLASSRH